MDFDLALVAGVLLIVAAVPAIMTALTRRRTPWVAIVILMFGCGVTATAIAKNPATFDVMDIPDAFLSVISRFTP